MLWRLAVESTKLMGQRDDWMELWKWREWDQNRFKLLLAITALILKKSLLCAFLIRDLTKDTALK